MRELYEKKYDNNERISVKGYHYVIRCELPEFTEHY